MKKMGKVARLASLLVLTLLFGLFPIGSGNNLNKVQAVTPLNNPRTVADSLFRLHQMFGPCRKMYFSKCCIHWF